MLKKKKPTTPTTQEQLPKQNTEGENKQKKQNGGE